jgi:Bacterial Ig-like domain (group 3)
MSALRKRLSRYGLIAMTFAAGAYGQNIVSCSNSSPQSVYPGPLNLRAEGTTELVGDLQFSCSNTGAPTATGILSAFLSAPVTSKLLTTDSTATPAFTEATLFICAGASACTSAVAQVTSSGTISGNQAVFTNLSFPAGQFTGRISNVRINASAVTLAPTLTTATELILASANGTSAATPAQTVGYIFTSLSPLSFLANPNGPGTAAATPYTTCVGDPLPATGNLNAGGATNYSFVATVAETFGGAFRSGTGASPAGEGGSYLGAGGAGTASFGTRIQLLLSNVSIGMTVYVPTAITSGNLTLQLVPSATAAEPASFPAVAPSSTAGAPTAGYFPYGSSATSSTEAYTASVAYLPSGGNIAVVYEVTATNAANIESANIPVWVVFAPNAFATAQGPITVAETYAPTATAANASTVPNFVAGTSAALNATTVSVCGTTSLTSSPNPSAFGQGVTLTANVTPATATGYVTFMDGATNLGTQPLSNGATFLTVSTLTAGSHSLTAVYAGDANDPTSISAADTQIVNKAPSSVALISSANPGAFGQTVTLIASVTPSLATGTVRFQDGSTTVGSASLSAGTATLVVPSSNWSVGTHTLTASYGGDLNVVNGTSATLSLVVDQPTTTTMTSLTATPNPLPLGKQATLTASVSPASATGNVTFYDGTTVLGTETLAGGQASLSTWLLGAGRTPSRLTWASDPPMPRVLRRL